MSSNLWVDPAQLSDGPGSFTSGAVQPRIDMVEDERELTVSVELAGVSEGDVRLSIDEGVLIIAGEKRPHSRQDWDRQYHLTERAFGAFRRTVRLPAGLDVDNADACFEEGVLIVRIPRLTPPQPSGRTVGGRAG